MAASGETAVRRAARLAFALVALALAAPAADAHPGGLNRQGCHRDRKRGGSHCHAGAPVASAPAPTSAAKPATKRRRAKVAWTFSGKVVGVSDGDTIAVMNGGRARKVRLQGVDAPEKRQAFGARAKQATSALVFRQVVTVIVEDRDRYGRLVGEVVLADGRRLSHELLRGGLAWMYRTYTKDAALDRLETAARTARVGLWSDPAPVAPWIFRHR